MAYNLLNNGMTVAASAVGNDQAVVPASFCAVPQAGAYSPTHYHHANQSSLSNTNLQGGSPEPSLSGSDDSGNTSKSTLLSGLVRSNPASRRGSVSSVVSNVGTPYAGNRKDGEKKFVCSYPGCKRAFSRNFNLSTHYVSAPLLFYLPSYHSTYFCRWIANSFLTLSVMLEYTPRYQTLPLHSLPQILLSTTRLCSPHCRSSCE